MEQAKLIIGILERALSGQITLKEFYETWPEEQENKFLERIFDDVESLIEHIPGSSTGEVYLNEISGMLEAKYVRADLEVVKRSLELCEDKLFNLREKYLSDY